LNFKLFLPFLFLLGCGIKGPPEVPHGTEITPWVNEYVKPLPITTPTSEVIPSQEKK